jgi:glutamate-1-semialdehyde 2,1-aminomutase
MAAGLTMLQTLNNDPAIFDRLAEKTAYFKGIEAALKQITWCIL